jgi:hypothetical protein
MVSHRTKKETYTAGTVSQPSNSSQEKSATTGYFTSNLRLPPMLNMSLRLCLSSAGLHRNQTINPVSVDLHKILRHVSAPVDFVNDWRGTVIVPKLLVGLAYFADTYECDTCPLDDMRQDFHRHPEFSCHHLLFSTPGNPINILIVDEIKSLLSRAILRGTADDLPPKLILNV